MTIVMKFTLSRLSMQEIKNGLRVPLDQTVIHVAGDLPRAKLSDFTKGTDICTDTTHIANQIGWNKPVNKWLI
ncbi:hypothetical protein MKW98_029022 [Papaver atlanticum]|uniref:Uncharacterized protein n=1 Tax=Papaver atlanticum TaxID=357466 RepID=A0AAD4S116_9MAGN|nr:hypothetical protein MKW98_029022 [Papaver atlanticum]